MSQEEWRHVIRGRSQDVQEAATEGGAIGDTVPAMTLGRLESRLAALDGGRERTGSTYFRFAGLPFLAA